MRFRILPLEERILFDASGASNVVNSYNFEHADVKASTTVLSPDHSGSENPGGDTATQTNTNKDNSATSDQTVNLNEKNSQDQNNAGSAKSVLVVSSQVTNAQQLIDATQTGVQTLYYDTSTTSLTELSNQIQQLLDGKQAESIGFVSYGIEGAFSLTGGNLVSLETLSSNADLQVFWKDVGNMVVNGGRIDLLACSVAGSPEGTSLINTLDQLLDNTDSNHYVNIAASSDITGNEAQSGNWNLEAGNVNVAKIYFAQTELSHWNGALDVPYMVKDIASSTTSSSPSNFTAVGNTIFFTANDGTNGVELWKTDGTTAGTSMVKDIYTGSSSSSPSNLVNMNGTLYFSANSASGIELWKSDGTSSGTVMVKDINTSGGSSPSNFLVINTTLYFSASDGSTSGIELWKSDGTTSGTVMVKDIYGGAKSSSPSQLTNVGGTIFFSAEIKDSGFELWKSDGTSTGTVQVKDINTSKGASSNPDNLINVNGTLFFTADSGTTGAELWKSDGTSAGTALVKDIYSGATTSNPTNFVAIGSTLYFTANTAAAGVELWKSDGTSSGTVIVKDIYSGASSSNVSSLTNVNGTLYFKATDATSGTELWKSDGTSSGTVMVKDIASGTTSSSPSNFVYSNGNIYFTASDAANGLELWRTDGTSVGTVIVQDINSGVASSSPGGIINVGTKLYFSATTATAGAELWAYNTSVAPVTGTDSYTLDEDASLTVNTASGLLANDTDADVDTAAKTFTITSNTNPSHGTLNYINSDGSFKYTPTANYSGTDSFTYTVTDGAGNTTTGTANITITPQNDAFSAVPAAQTINEDASLVFNSANSNLITVSDAVSSTMQVTLSATNGALTLSRITGLTFTSGDGTADGTMVFSGSTANINAALNGMTFTPTANYNGSASIAITTKDEGSTGATNNIAVTISPMNDALSSVPGSQTINEDASLVFNSANSNLITVSDAVSSTMQVTLSATNGALTLSRITGLTFTSGDGTADGTMVFSGSTANINAALNGMTFTPTANYNGSASIAITTKDEGSTGATNNIAVTISPMNDALSSVPGSQTINEDASLVFNSANSNLITVSDAVSSTMQVTLSATNGALTLSRTTGLTFTSGDGTADGTMVFSGSTANINAALNGMTFTPTANYNGSANIAITTKDEGSTGSTNNIAVTISPMNDALSSVPGDQTINEDASLVFNSANNNLITVSDATTNTMQVTLTTTNGALTLSRSSGLIFSSGDGTSDSTMVFTGSTANINAALNGMTFTPISNYSGSANIAITTKDEGSTGATNNIAITINPMNDALSSVPGAQTINEDTSLVFNSSNNNLISVNDAVMGTMQVTLTSTHGLMTLNGTNGISFISGDGTGDSTMVFTGTTANINAALDGMTFDPTANYNGNANIAITTKDEGSEGITNNIAVTINPTNDALSSVPDAQTVNEDTNLIFNAENSNLISVSDAVLGTMQVTLASTHGALTLSGINGLSFSTGDGTADNTMTFIGSTADINAALNGMAFAPNANYNGPASIAITTQDEGSEGITSNIAITINPTNDALSSVPEAQTINEDTSLVFNSENNNLISVSDAVLGTMQVTLTSTHGALTLSGTNGLSFSNGDGISDSTMTFNGSTAAINAALNGLTFTPNANYNGAAFIGITTQDEGSEGITNNIALTINPTNDALSSVPDAQTINEDTGLVFNSSNNNLISVSDSVLGTMHVTLTSTNGTLTLNGTNGLSFSSGDGLFNNTMTFTGSTADINAALNGMAFAPNANYNGIANIAITTQDEGSEGFTNNIAITINPTNDAISSVPGAQTIIEDSSLVFNSENNNLISVSDAVIGTMQVTLTSTHGALTLSGTSGLSFSNGDGSADTTMTFTGSTADINAALNGMSFAPNSNYNGPANIAITTQDEGSQGTTNNIALTINPINDALSSVPDAQTVNEDTSLIFNAENSNLISVSDAVLGTIQVTLTSSHGALTLSGINGLSFSTGDGTADNTMTFIGSTADINAALNGMSFTPNANYNGAANIAITTQDEGSEGFTNNIAITINPVNDALSSVPTPQTIIEDSNLVFNSENNNLISVSDAVLGTMQVTLTSTHGALTLSGISGLSFSNGDGSADTTMTFTGSTADINAALNGMSFAPNLNYNGPANIAITTQDEGSEGTTNNIAITVNPANDALSSVPGTQNVIEDASLVFNSENNNLISVSDAVLDTIQVTLTSTNGALTLSGTSGLSFSNGNGIANSTMTFTGSTADINAALSGMSFKPTDNYHGTANIAITTQDEGLEGTTNNVAIIINPVNDALSSVPNAQTINEDSSLIFSTANNNLISVSDAVLGTIQVTLNSTNGSITLSGTNGLNFSSGDGISDSTMIFTGTTADINIALNGMSFTPTANYNGEANIAITTHDEGAEGATNNIPITISPMNDAVAVIPNTQIVNEDATLIFNSTNNNLISIDSQMDSVQVTLTATNGTLTLNGTAGLSFSNGNGVNNSTMVFTGSVNDINSALNGLSFQPLENFNGQASVSIAAMDEGVTAEIHEIAVTVNPLNDALSTVPGSQIINEDSALVFNSINDNLISVSDVASGTIQVTLSATQGSLSLNGTHGLNFLAGDGSNDTTLIFSGTVSDINNALNGLTFTPIENYNGTATISITTIDEGSLGQTNAISVDIIPLNDSYSTVPGYQIVNEDAALVFNEANGNPITVSEVYEGTMKVILSAPHATLTLSSTEGLNFINGDGQQDCSIVFTGSTANINRALNGLTLTPLPNYNGSAALSITTLDEGSTGETNLIAITVNPVNDALSIVPSTQTMSEDSSLVFNSVNGNLISVSDAVLGTMEVTLTSTNGTLSLNGTSGLNFTTGHGIGNSTMVFTGTTADINAALDGMTFSPIANYNGSANISITTLDEGLTGTTNDIAVIINPMNDAFSTVPTTQIISEDTSLVFNSVNGNLINVSDAVLGTMEVTLTSTNGTLALNGTSGLNFTTGNGINNSTMVFTGTTADINAALNGMTFSPIANYNGSANISITTLDEGSAGTTKSIAVIINPMNDAFSSVPTTQTISEDTSLVFTSVNGNLISVNDAVLGTMEVTLTSTNGTLALNGTSGLSFTTGHGIDDSTMVFTGTTADINAALNGMTFNPIANYNGSANISITTLDEGLAGTTNHIAVIINPMNDAFSSVPTTQTMIEDTNLVFSTVNDNLINVSDAVLGTIEVTLTSTNGTLSLNGTSGLNFTTGNGIGNSTMVFTGTTADINAALNGMAFSPIANYNGPANISISTLDEGSVAANSTISVIINPINDALSTVPATQIISEDASLIFNSTNGNLISVSDAVLGTMEVTLTSTNGTISLNGTNGLNFTIGNGIGNSTMVFTGTTADINAALNGMTFSPIANYNGSANISITTFDEGVVGTTNNIPVIINPINDAFSSVPASQTINEDSSLVFNSVNGNLISVSDTVLGTMEVTLTSTNGSLSLNGTNGLSFTTGHGISNTTMVFTGTTADINAALNGMTFSPIANYNGSANISITTLDEGSAGTTNNIAVIISPINDAFSSVPASQTINEDTSLVFNSVNGNLISVSDTILGTMEVTLTSTNGSLSLNGTSGLSFTTGNGIGNSTMVFTGTTADINAALNGMTFSPITNYNGSANISITTLDEGSAGTTNNIAVIINPMNDAFSTVPTAQTISEDTSLVFNSVNSNLISVNDAVLGTMKITLTSTNGTLSLNGTSGLSFTTGNGIGNNTMVFTGTTTDINAALNGMAFTPIANYNGSANISITTLDEGSSGTTNHIAVIINPVNDAHSIVPTDQTMTEDSTLVFNSNNNNLIAVSTTGASEIMEVTLTSTNGNLSLNGITGITFISGTGTNENTMIFSGTATDINAALNGLSFTPNPNFNGSATISLTTLNEGFNGEVKSINIQIDPLNDAIATVPVMQTTNQDTSLIFNSTNGNLISISDSVAGTIQVTLTVTHGTLTLNGTEGLLFSGGDGLADSSMIFTGTLSDINSALNGMSFNPTNQYVGTSDITITAIDEGLIGSTHGVAININAIQALIIPINPTITQDQAFVLPYATNSITNPSINEMNIQENASKIQIDNITMESTESAPLSTETEAIDTIMMQDKVNKVMSTKSPSETSESIQVGLQGQNQTNISNSNGVLNESQITGEAIVKSGNPYFDALFTPYSNLSIIGVNQSENSQVEHTEKQALAKQGEDSPPLPENIHSSETAQLLNKAVMSTLIIDNAWSMNAAEKNANIESQQETDPSELNIPKLTPSEQAIDQMMTSVAAFALTTDHSELPDSITYAHETSTYSNIVKIIKK